MATREGTVAALAAVFDTVRAHLDERQRRCCLGPGRRCWDTARSGWWRGLPELESAEALPGRVRGLGGGRKRAADRDPGLRPALLALVEPEERVDFLDATIAALTEQIDARTEPFQAAKQLLSSVPGFDRLVIDTVIAETGADMSRFPSPGHLAKWAGVCPGNHESAGKRRRVGITPGNSWLRRALIEAARAAARTRGSYFGAQYRQIAKRRGPNKAAVAVAHSLSDLIWHQLTTGECFHDLGDDYFQRRRDPERETRRLVAQLQQLGFHVALTPSRDPAA